MIFPFMYTTKQNIENKLLTSLHFLTSTVIILLILFIFFFTVPCILDLQNMLKPIWTYYLEQLYF